MQDARIFGNDPARVAGVPPYKDSADLRMGYVELGDPESKPLSLRAGRQELNFGEQRLVGSTNWSNVARTFDAVRITARTHGIRLDAFASSVVSARDDVFDRPLPGNNLHGLYASTAALVPNSVVEAYGFWRLAPRLAAESGGTGNLDSKTIGTRWVGKLPARFDYAVEMALQTGSLGRDSVGAWGGYWHLGYSIPCPRLKPRLIFEYNYATGDRDPRDGRRGTFDVLYPTGHDKYGLADQVGWRNIRQARAGVELKPWKRWMLLANFQDFRRASVHDGLYNSAGTLTVPSGSATAAHIGEELDGQAMYTVSKQVQVGAGVGHLFAGAFLKQATPGRGYTYPYLTATYVF
jgi:hypothetical protein